MKLLFWCVISLNALQNNALHIACTAGCS